VDGIKVAEALAKSMLADADALNAPLDRAAG